MPPEPLSLIPSPNQHLLASAEPAVRCRVSQECYCIYYSLALGIADERTDELVSRLVKWQWPDGGWNCDKNPAAVHSSFMESLIPMRALALYARQTGDPAARQSVERAAEIFLKRDLFKRRRDGAVMRPEFIALFYPYYWRYNILAGLKAMAEIGYIGDPRCQPALDLLETKRLPDGGFPAEMKYYRLTERQISGRSRFDWGGVHPHRMNEFISVEALYVLKASGRLSLS
jgi:hypothetical protein